MNKIKFDLPDKSSLDMVHSLLVIGQKVVVLGWAVNTQEDVVVRRIDWSICIGRVQVP